MRLQKRQTRKYEGKDYYKWVVTIPPDEVDRLGWKEGIQLESSVSDDKLILHPSKVKKP